MKTQKTTSLCDSIYAKSVKDKSTAIEMISMGCQEWWMKLSLIGAQMNLGVVKCVCVYASGVLVNFMSLSESLLTLTF